MKLQPQECAVLIIESEAGLRHDIESFLQGKGYQVSVADSGETALKFLVQQDLPHIIFTATSLPGISGLDLIEKIHHTISDEVEIVALVHEGALDAAKEARKLGAFATLLKPLRDLNEVDLIVHRAVEHTALIQKIAYLKEKKAYVGVTSEKLEIEMGQFKGRLNQLAQYSFELSQRVNVADVINYGVDHLSRAVRTSPAVFFSYQSLQGQIVAKAFSNIHNKYWVRTAYPIKNIDPDAVKEELKEISQGATFLELLHQSYKFQFSKVFHLSSADHPLGLLAMDVNPPLSDLEEGVFRQFISIFSLSLSNAINHETIQTISQRDWLTGLLNNHAFKDRLETEFQRSYRLRHPLALLFIDIDHFNKYNELNGTPAGDKILRKMGSIFQSNFRVQDLLGRYNGETFVVAMTHTPFEAAANKAKMIRKLIEETPFFMEHTQPDKKITVSVGVAGYPHHGNSMEELIRVADDCLNKAKSAGRNRVVAATPPSHHVPSFSPVHPTAAQ